MSGSLAGHSNVESAVCSMLRDTAGLSDCRLFNDAMKSASRKRRSTLAGLETALHLVDDVDAALAANKAVVAMAAAQ
jgi:hypothetical protein